jgi:hypothetical protein
MPLMSAFEANLARLNWIKNEMWTLYEEMPKFKGKDVTNTQIITSIVGAFITIRLDIFIKIRRELLRDLQERDMLGLDECLCPFWEPIVKYEVQIAQLRNNFFAHMQETSKPFEMHSEEIGILSGFPTGTGDARFYAACVWKYVTYIEKNFKEDVRKAEEKYRLTMSVGSPVMKVPVANVRVVLEQTEHEVREILRKHGFAT